MHLFMATLSTETNTFSPVPTVLSDYEAHYMRHGTATQDAPKLMTEALHVWRQRAEALDWFVTESLTAIAEPAGLTTASAFDTLKNEILGDLRNSAKPNVVLLQLYGAMVAEGEPDCEGRIVSEIQALCPDAVIGVALDLHCHLRPRLLEHADLLIAFREYPHDDAATRADELFSLVERQLAGEISPQIAMFDCRMVSLFLTKTDPMRAFIKEMEAAEDIPGVLSVTLGHGFPWADLPETGARMMVTTDSDLPLAQETAKALGQRFFGLCDEVAMAYSELDEALDQVEATRSGPIVLADMSDNSGAGAPGDSTYVLEAILERGLRNVASAIYWDPDAVQACVGMGEGAEIELDLGGKVEVASGRPVNIRGQIMAIKSGLKQHLGPALEPLGTMVWLRLEGEIELVINDLRIQVYHPEVFEQMGIELSQKHLVVVKSLFHFYTPFAEIASDVIFCATPGRVNPNTARIGFKQRDLNFWPRVHDPFALD